jgi:2-oxoisovalerate dehydrogenase E1 component
MESIDDFFVRRASALPGRDGRAAPTDATDLLSLFDAQAQSRHLDFAARWLQAKGKGFYTIASAGHEANAALGMVSRVMDPALLHYRSGALYAARADRYCAEHPDRSFDAIENVLLSLASASTDPMSGGRHKVFGHPSLHIIPQTSTIASHLPRAVGLAFALNSLPDNGSRPWPQDAIVLASFGDASVNHSTAQGALNAAAYLRHRGIDVPVLFVCEDNSIGISTRTPEGWTETALRSRPGLRYFAADGVDPDGLLAITRSAVAHVRAHRTPAVLHLRTVRFMGHAGSDVELGYRSQAEVLADYERDPLLATAARLTASGTVSATEVLERYEAVRRRVMSRAEAMLGAGHLSSRAEVTAPLLVGLERPGPHPGRGHMRSVDEPDRVARRGRVWAGKEPERQPPMTLAQTINAALVDALAERPNAVVFGEDVAVKGGVYGVTRGLRKRFGGRRVFDTLLDEQTVLGTALGAALAGVLPIPEIQYLAYLHNAEDQLRGEAASLSFFSDGQYRNPMVVRIAGLAYQKGFGGHFHNDNSVAVLRDIPGLVVCVPSHPEDAAGLLRECLRLADEHGRVCVYLEPIALYHRRDLHHEGDDRWTAPYRPPGTPASGQDLGLGVVRTWGEGQDLLIVTFGNGTPMSLRAARALEAEGIDATVLDLRWLSPLPVRSLVDHALRFAHVLVVDETRRSGGVAESVLAALVDARHPGVIARLNSADSFIPLGPAAYHVLLDESEIVTAARELTGLRG